MWRILLPLMVLAFLVGCAPVTQQPGDPFTEPVSGQGEDVDMNTTIAAITDVTAQVLPSGLVEIGSASAPHTLLLLITPGSPYSRTYVQTYLPQVIDTWVKPGTLRVHIGFVPFNRYPQTLAASVAFLCATARGEGLPVLDALMTNPAASPPPADCQYTEAHLAGIRSLISSLHVSLVPTAFIDGEKETGLPDWADLRAEIERLVKE